MKRLLRYFFIMATVFVAVGCSSMSSQNSGDAVLVDSLRGAPPLDRRTMTVLLNRETYIKALEKEGAVNQARLVEVFHRGQADNELKEYRLLDIRPGSVYDLLGLQHADILIAANGYVVPVPQMFWNYLRLIARFEQANLEVRRDGTPLLLEYQFIEAAGPRS
jgi:hypothetical protein